MDSMDTIKDWHYGKKTKPLLSKRKTKKGNIDALRELKKKNKNTINIIIIINMRYYFMCMV